MVKAFMGILFLAALAVGIDILFTNYKIPVPAPIIVMAGLAVFYAVFGRVPDFIDTASERLFRIFPLLFIPALVGVVTVLHLVAANLIVLLFAITFSSLLGLVVAARLYVFFARKGAKR